MPYVWENATITGSAPPDIPTPPAWWMSDNSAGLLLSQASPGGEGDILVRTEVSLTIGVEHYPVTITEQSCWNLRFELAGDVGASGGPPPDALGTGPGRFALVASTRCEFQVSDPYGASDSQAEHAVYSTEGYVTSRAKRGPAVYGAIHPYFLLGINVINGPDLTIPGGHFGISYTAILRTLWKTA